jgi:hypothetical protein
MNPSNCRPSARRVGLALASVAREGGIATALGRFDLPAPAIGTVYVAASSSSS